jgi:hypothetical protein
MSKFANILPGVSGNSPSRAMGGGSAAAAPAASMQTTPAVMGMFQEDESLRRRILGNQSQSGLDGILGDLMKRGDGGILPERGSEQQRDLVNALVQQGMASAGQSGSPLLALLAPMAGMAASTRANSLYDSAQEAEAEDSYAEFAKLTGASPAALELLRMMDDPNMPKAAKDQLAKRYEAMTGGGSRPSAAQEKERLFGEYEIDGVLHGRNSYGKMVPYTGDDGQLIRKGDDGYMNAPRPGVPEMMTTPPGMGPAPQSDRAPRPGGPMSDEDLINKYLG